MSRLEAYRLASHLMGNKDGEPHIFGNTYRQMANWKLTTQHSTGLA